MLVLGEVGEGFSVILLTYILPEGGPRYRPAEINEPEARSRFGPLARMFP
jgi:hypothetical protein